MHFKKAFPGKYLQSSDLDVPFIATVQHVTNENIGQGDHVELKPIVAWVEDGLKSVVLNLTRAEALAALAKDEDMDRWPGTRVLVRKGSTRYQGRRVDCIEFAAPTPAPRGSKRDQAKPASPRPAAVDLGEAFEEPSDGEAF